MVKKDMLKDVHDVKAVRELGMGLSDHMILCKKKLVGRWTREGVEGSGRKRSKVKSF